MSRITSYDAAGTIVGDELIVAYQKSTSVTITATTISATASSNSFGDSGSGFVAAGFAVDDLVTVGGFSASGCNLVGGVITSLSAGTMTIGGADGDTIVDEAAGNSVTITKWVTVRAPYPTASGGGGGWSEITVTNGDFETGDETGWTVTVGTDPVQLGATTYSAVVGADNGSYIFLGGESGYGNAQAQVTAHQDVDVSGYADSAVFAAKVQSLKNFADDDQASIAIQLFNSDGEQLGDGDTQSQTITTAGTQTLSPTILGHPDADYIRITLSITRNTGTNNNAALDNVRLFAR